MRSALILLAFALAWVLPLSAAQTGGKEQPKSLTPAEAARKALDQKTTLDFVGQSLQEAVNHLREKTKVNFILDNQAAQGMAIGPDGQPLAIQQVFQGETWALDRLAQTDEDGIAEIQLLEPGTYRLRLQTLSGAADSVEVEVHEGQISEAQLSATP